MNYEAEMFYELLDQDGNMAELVTSWAAIPDQYLLGWVDAYTRHHPPHAEAIKLWTRYYRPDLAERFYPV
jgi:hypothetical protein